MSGQWVGVDRENVVYAASFYGAANESAAARAFISEGHQAGDRILHVGPEVQVRLGEPLPDGAA